MALKVVLNSLLIPRFGHQGIAVASSITYLITDLVFVAALWWYGIRFRLRTIASAATSGIAMGAVVILAAYIARLMTVSYVGQIGSGIGGAVAALIILYRYGPIGQLLGAQTPVKGASL